MITAELPDGTQLEFPDGTDNAVIQQTVKRMLKIGAAQQIATDDITKSAQDPTSGMSTLEKFNAGMGKAFSDLGGGFMQLIGQGPTAQEVAETTARDKPLMASGAGLAGNVAGNMAAATPLAVVPGANTIAGAGALGATLGALQPTTSITERLLNAGVGGGLGAGGQWLGGALASRAAQKQANIAKIEAQHAMRDATLRESQQAGYVVPPSAVNQSFVNKRLESIAGKAAVGQEAAYRNQGVTNLLARRAVGIPDDVPISEGALDGIRKVASGPYKEVAALSDDAAQALEVLREARFNATAHFKHYERSSDPAALTKAKTFSTVATKMEGMLEDIAAQSGKSGLVDDLRDARKTIAKTWDIEKALNVATGDVSAPTIGRALDRGAPLTGELLTVGKFAQAFPSYAREGAKIPTPGVSKSEALASALLGLGGAGVTGSPVGAVAGLLPLASGPVRSGVLSRTGQGLLAQPNYGGSMLANLEPEEVARISRTLLPALYFGSR